MYYVARYLNLGMYYTMLEISKFAFENPDGFDWYGATDARPTDRQTYVLTYLRERRRRKLRVSVNPTRLA